MELTKEFLVDVNMPPKFSKEERIGEMLLCLPIGMLATLMRFPPVLKVFLLAIFVAAPVSNCSERPSPLGDDGIVAVAILGGFASFPEGLNSFCEAASSWWKTVE